MTILKPFRSELLGEHVLFLLYAPDESVGRSDAREPETEPKEIRGKPKVKE